LLIELEDKLIRWFSHVRGIDTTRLLSGEFELKFKGKKPVE
jgi:hypothetical protein